jgi:hypothetical protein
MFLHLTNSIKSLNFPLNTFMKTKTLFYFQLAALTVLLFFLQVELFCMLWLGQPADWIFIQIKKFGISFFILELKNSPIKTSCISLVILLVFSIGFFFFIKFIKDKTFFDLILYVFSFVVFLVVTHSLIMLFILNGGFHELPNHIRRLALWI